MRITPFACDWSGRYFAIDNRRLKNSEPLILMLDPGSGESFEIPATIIEFHDEELVNYSDDVLAKPFFLEWKNNTNGSAIQFNQCVGYKTPLFLGGEDVVENLELQDLDIYTSVCGQLFNKIRHLKSGQKISKITIS